ncbi:flagellin [Cognatishimia sp. F0-27]|uniref:flagellin n=1 Tax=Cognatishimia sp. F0-27 TaxID=2816855 RepID=UPI001D0C95F0|nr:flagellin [Cognatishimia sp. F0-27]MCC1492389.1 flagellar biosynthesis protein FlgL [Cognatishimia sp. F0-27]
MDSIGDLARTFVLRSNQTRLRAEMDQRAVEIATGFTSDPTKRLGGDVAGLISLDRSMARLEAFRISTAEARFVTQTMQSTLEEIQTRGESVSQILISAELTPTGNLLETMTDGAESALEQTISALNRSVAGRSLFAGRATDQIAVVDKDTLISTIRSGLTGLTQKADIEAALNNFFSDGGDFDSLMYQGSQLNLAPIRISDTTEVRIDIRADSPELKDTLKSLAQAVLANDPGLNLKTETRLELIKQSGEDLLENQGDLIKTRAALGATQALVEENLKIVENSTTSSSITKLELVGIDPYESASRYENIRAQLESLYAITARSQRLSLAEYL